MKRITENYDASPKDDLLTEASSRGITTVNTASLKADIVAALELDDEQHVKQPRAPLPPLMASQIPQVKVPDNIPAAPGDAPKDEDYTDGIFTKGGEDFALAIVKDEPSGRTHHLKNSLHYENVTEADFKAQFEKK